MPLYCIDANIFIEAKNNSYPLDMFPAFWEWIDRNAHAGIIFSSTLVCAELISGKDDLAEWISDRSSSPLFREPSPRAQEILTKISEYVTTHYTREEAEAFLAGADPWVIAQAIDSKAKVVTMEKLAGSGSKKVKIPNICHEFEINWCNTITMLRELGAKF